MYFRDYEERAKPDDCFFPYTVQTEARREDFFSRFPSFNFQRAYYPTVRPNYLPAVQPPLIHFSIELTLIIEDLENGKTPYIIRVYVKGCVRPNNFTDPTGEWFLIDDLIYLGVGAIIGTVNGIMNFTQTGNVADIFLGTVSGAGSMWLNGNGVPLYFSLSTKGYSAGVGYNFGGLVNVGAGVHGSWDGSNVGFSTNIGLGGPNGGPGVGLSFGMDYNREGGWSSNVGANVSFGLDKSGSTSLSLGVNARFDSQGYAGWGTNIGISGRNENGISAGFNMGMSFDRNGQFESTSMGLTMGYSGKRTNEFGTSYMSYSESLGINAGRDGRASGYGNYSSSRTFYTPEQEAQLKQAENLKALKKQFLAESKMLGKTPANYTLPKDSNDTYYPVLVPDKDGNLQVKYVSSSEVSTVLASNESGTDYSDFKQKLGNGVDFETLKSVMADVLTMEDLRGIYGNPKYGVQELAKSLYWTANNLAGIGNSPEKAFQFIKDNKDLIIQAANEFKIPPAMVAAVLFREMTCYDVRDNLGDVPGINNKLTKNPSIFARQPSIGVGQITLKTANLAEVALNQTIHSPQELKTLLLDDKNAIRYVAMVLKYEATKIINPDTPFRNYDKDSDLRGLTFGNNGGFEQTAKDYSSTYFSIINSYNGDPSGYYGTITTDYARVFGRYFQAVTAK